jgi:hypothetical protein
LSNVKKGLHIQVCTLDPNSLRPKASVQGTGAFLPEQVPHDHFVKISDISDKQIQHNLFTHILQNFHDYLSRNIKQYVTVSSLPITINIKE